MNDHPADAAAETTPDPPHDPARRVDRPVGRRERIVSILLVLTLLFLLLDTLYPMFNGVSARAFITAASAQAHGVHIGLMQYASDHDGEFPIGEHDSNEALRQLIPRYVEDEKPFYVAGSAWHTAPQHGELGPGPDNLIGDPPDYPRALEEGENHWAYVSGLNNHSDERLPLLADGFSYIVGTYATHPSRRGGVWRGSKAIVTYADGSTRSEFIDPKTLRVLKNGRDLFDPASIPPGTKILNPR